MFLGAIFDVDGTILDSMWVWKNMTANFMKSKNILITEAEIAGFKDMPLEESMLLIKSRFGFSETVDEVKEMFINFCFAEYMENVAPKDGILEYIKRLKQKGVKIAVATSGYREFCEAAMKKFGILEYIDAFAFSSEVGVNKRNPDVYFLAAERIGIMPQACMVFEDILAGILGAKAGGMMTTAIYDESSKEEWEEIKREAQRSILSWRELNEY